MEALEDALRSRGLDTVISSMPDTVRAQVVVVDSYELRADDARFEAGVVVAIDDLDRDLAVDIVVDPSPGSTPAPHRRASFVLAGPQYALLGPGLPRQVRAPADLVRRVLVSLGGHDPRELAWCVARELATRHPDVVVTCTGGPPDEADRHGVELAATRSGLGESLAASDLVVCAGGVTLLESLVLRRPTIVVVVARNQRRAAEAVASAGAGVLATPETAAQEASTLIPDLARRHALVNSARDVVDLRGPERVADAVVAQLGRVAP